MRSLLSRTGQFILAVARRPLTWLALAGVWCGLLLVAVFQYWVGRFGMSLPVTSVLAGCGLIGLGMKSQSRDQLPHWYGGRDDLWLPGLMAVTVGLLPWVYDLASLGLAQVPLEVLAGRWGTLLFLFPVGLLTVSLPLMLMVRFVQTFQAHHAAKTEPGILSGTFWLSVSTGVLLQSQLLAPLAGLEWTTWTSIALGLAVLLTVAYRRRSQAVPTGMTTEPGHHPTLTEQLSLLLTGALAVVLVRYLTQLSPASTLQIYSAWGGLGLGLGLGMILNARWRPAAGACWSGLLLANWCVLLLALFPWLVYRMLSLLAQVTDHRLVLLVRVGLSLVVLLPLGLAMAFLLPRRSVDRLPFWKSPLLGWGLGCVGMLWCFRAGLPAGYALAIAAGGLALGAWPGWWQQRAFPARRLVRLSWGVASLAVLLAPLVAGQYAPALAGKLLFSSQVFLTHRSGQDADKLLVLDDSRVVLCREAEQGTLVATKSLGVRYLLRESGIPKAQYSTDTDLAPQFSGEMMPALLPLTIHENPQSILFLGYGSGLGVTACLSSPLQTIHCLESSSAYLDLLRQHALKDPAETSGTDESLSFSSRHQEDDPWTDQRVRVLTIDPILGLQSRTQRYDVIVSNPDLPVLMHSGGCYTRDFYRHASRRLTADGIFCQRFQFHDLGAEPVQQLLQTVQSEFAQVIPLEAAANELLILATNSPAGLVRPGLVERLRTPQNRRLLSQLNWDWAIPLQVTAFDDARLRAAISEADRGTNTTRNATLAFSLPGEVTRWGDKAHEVREAMLPCLAHYLEWVVTPDNQEDITRRIKELGEQRQLMLNYPDQPWVYRKTIRKYLQESPRTEIVWRKGQKPKRELHAEDQRRLDYFSALGLALQNPELTPLDIQAVEHYLTPFDPLLTYFVHDEAARLHARCTERDPGAELRHRLHTVYHADVWDRSITNITAAIGLLAEHPDTVGDPAQRWDHYNALAQLLKRRWELRGEYRAGDDVQVAMNDVDRSLTALDQAFTAMEGLAPEIKTPPEQWVARRRYLETNLSAPLRGYRQRLLEHHNQQRARQPQPAAPAPAEPSIDPEMFSPLAN